MNEQQEAFAASLATASSAEACLIEAFTHLGTPRTLLDVGCGSGHVVRLARTFGVEAFGIDLYVKTSDYTTPWDLTQPYAGHFDWVLCWEVAEHLHANAADTLCDTLARVTAQRLLFSAAIPGQGGNGHYNEQPHAYWQAKLEARGMRLHELDTRVLRDHFARVAPQAWWYGQNIQVFDAN